MKESNVQKLIQLALSDAGCVSFRNNCGVLKNEAGIPIKFGVGNPGGSDLIGITPLCITAEMVGQTVGVFTAIEVKTKTGRVRPDQINFMAVVKSHGGLAGICRSTDDALRLIAGENNDAN